MNYKDNKEYKGIPSPYSFRYFDRRVPEEDTPIEVLDEVNQKYEELDLVFEENFDENSLHLAKQQSKEEREKKGLNESSFVYGEITFRSLSYIFEYVKSKFGDNAISKGTFLDLGSGIGRGIVAASLIYPFDKYIGIEFLENLHLIAVEVKNIYELKTENIIKTSAHLVPFMTSTPNLEIINGDFLICDWSEASFVFANSTCFSQELMHSLSKKAEELKPGCFFVTFTKRLPELSENWQVCDGFRRLMSWGIATIYIHRKIK